MRFMEGIWRNQFFTELGRVASRERVVSARFSYEVPPRSYEKGRFQLPYKRRHLDGMLGGMRAGRSSS
jgi:hypothetical protein